MVGKIYAMLVFGLIGMAAFGYGRKQRSPKAITIGILLMAYPYMVSGNLALWGIGAGLTVALFIFRD
jgi:hypothetical protein